MGSWLEFTYVYVPFRRSGCTSWYGPIFSVFAEAPRVLLVPSCLVVRNWNIPTRRVQSLFHPITILSLSPILPSSLFFTTPVTKLLKKALSIIWRVEVDLNGLCHTCLNGRELCTLPGDKLLLRFINDFFCFFFSLLSVVKSSFAGNFRTVNHQLENCAHGLMAAIPVSFWLWNLGLAMSPPGVLGSVSSFMLHTGHTLDLSTLPSVSCGLDPDDGLLWN